MKRYIAIKRRNGKRGSLMVEAAVFLPIFIISILTLGMLMKQAGTEETALHAMVNQGRLLSVMAYSAEAEEGDQSVAGAGLRLLFQSGLEKQLQKELGWERDAIRLNRFRSLYKESGRDQLIEAAADFDVVVPLPKAVKNRLSGEVAVVFRAFTGRGGEGEPVPIEELETEKASYVVYIFPREGKRYHGKSCKIISSAPERTILNRDLKRRYKSCGACGSAGLASGSLVYCFTGYGGVYHNRGCRYVEKHVISIERDEALEKGYTPCMKCGGG